MKQPLRDTQNGYPEANSSKNASSRPWIGLEPLGPCKHSPVAIRLPRCRHARTRRMCPALRRVATGRWRQPHRGPSRPRSGGATGPTGAIGPAGADGVSGHQVITDATCADSGTGPRTCDASCSSSKSVLGGDFSVSGFGQVRESRPNGDGWRIVENCGTNSPTVYAICGTAN